MKAFMLAAVVLAAWMGSSPASAQTYGPSSQSGYGAPGTVRCESRRGDRTFCRAQIRGPVRVIRQLSRTACVRGHSWYATNSGIWVSNGCRADFAVGRTTNPNPNTIVRDDHFTDRDGRTVHCESTASGRTYCGNSHSRYTMANNRDPDCIEGRTWGSDQRGVWVSGDCEADFTGSPYDWRGQERNRHDSGSEEVAHEHIVDPSGRMIHCQSTADGRNYCGDRDSRYVIQTRDADCIEGVTYGQDARGMWVSGECDARFLREDNDGGRDHDDEENQHH